MRFFVYLCVYLSLIVPAYAQEDDLVSAIQAVPTEDSVETKAEDISPKTESPDLNLKDEKMREFEDAPILRLRILDKVRAESRTYELNVGRTVAYNNLRIRPRACRKSSPLDEPESAAFLQIWEVRPDDSSAWVFSGWMFASSPSISGMDHPVYDVTVLECKVPESEKPKEESATPKDGEDTPMTEEEKAEAEKAAVEEGGEDQETSTTGAEEPTNETSETPSALDNNE